MIRRLGVGVLLCVVLASCSSKDRKFVTSSGLSPDAGGSPSGADDSSDSDSPDTNASVPGSLAAPCASANECESGSCVDGVCCRTSCDTVCTRCDAPGREGECTVTASDPACSVSCPEASDCRTYGSSAVSANCEAAGLCRTVTGCAPNDAPGGTTCAAGAGTCDGLGECIVPGKKRLGEACTGGAECGQAECVVGSGGVSICCDAACAGLCRACGANGRCDQTPRDDARCPTVDCPVDDVCRNYTDDFTVNLCRGYGTCRNAADCTFDDLHPGAECACEASGCRLTPASICETSDQCSSGACEATPTGANLCCAEACSGQGLTCSDDGARCVQCEGDATECASPTASRRCTGNSLVTDDCGNGCDSGTGVCAALRATGAVCDTAAQCESAICSLDVTGTNRCCDADCGASSRVCGTGGSCVCPSNRVDVNGTCRLVEGETCTTGDDCASSNCAVTVSGANVCCVDTCDGAFCAGDGAACVQCEGSGSECQGNTSERCQDNVVIQTPCGNGCNAANGVCNGLLVNGQTCNANNQCASSVCAADVTSTNRCCTSSCAASGRVCGVDGSCVCADPDDVFVRGQCRSVEGQSCDSDGDCRSNACENTQASGEVCCSGACNGQICRASGQGCVQCEGGPPTCQGGNSRSCVNNAFLTTTCANGCNANTGLCNNLIAQGSTGCSRDAQCSGSGSSCQNGRCCEFNCAAAGRECDNGGVCRCPTGTTPVGSACLISNGEECERADQCASGRCDRWFRDVDGDLHGDPNEPIRTCGTASSAPPAGFVASNDDCCDRNDTEAIRTMAATMFGGQASFFATAQTACTNVGAFDYNCDGAIESFFQEETERFGGISCNMISVADCGGGLTRWSLGVIPACGSAAGFDACNVVPRLPNQCTSVNGGLTVNNCR